jgi:hypothetical protein
MAIDIARIDAALTPLQVRGHNPPYLRGAAGRPRRQPPSSLAGPVLPPDMVPTGITLVGPHQEDQIMGQASANAFLDRLEHDSTLQQAWQTARSQAVHAAMVAMGSLHGSPFTLEELRGALSEREHQLGDQDLAKASGGGLTLDLSSVPLPRFAPQPEPPGLPGFSTPTNR